MNLGLPTPTASESTVTWIAPGDLTSTTESAFHAAIERLTATPAWRVLALDLRAARTIDSKGLNVLVSVVKSAREGGRKVVLVAPQPTVRRILAFTRIDRHVDIVEAGAALS